MKHALVSLLLGTSVLTSGTAMAEDLYAIVPPHQIDDQKTLESFLQTLWEETGRGDSFTVIDAHTADTVVTVSIPDKGRYEVQKFKNTDFRSDIAGLRDFVVKANATPAPDAIDWRSDIPEALDRISELRAGATDEGRVLVFTSPLHRVDYNPTLSMIADDGGFRVASDGFLLGDRMASPYGRPEQRDGLSGLSIDFCAVLPPISAHETSEIMRQWGYIIALQGGRLSSFTTDSQVCLQRFQARVTTPLIFRPLDPKLDPVMVGADMSSEATQITVSAMKELGQARNAALAEIEALEAALSERDDEVDGLTRQRDEAAAELNQIKSALGQTEERDGAEVLDFSKFTSVPHPVITSLTITTGVSYDDGFPSRYTSSWCYFQRLNDQGGNLRFEVGSKSPGQAIEWERADADILSDVDLTPLDFTAARASCRFPED